MTDVVLFDNKGRRARECGACSLCCKLIGVQELGKLAGKWCEHADPGRGCKIWHLRPGECQAFSCLWLQATPEQIPDELRPDKSKVVMATNKEGTELILYVDPARPDAFKEWRVVEVLKQFPVFRVICGKTEKFFGRRKES